MMRFVENRRKIKIVEIENAAYSVDIPTDLEKVIPAMKADKLKDLYY